MDRLLPTRADALAQVQRRLMTSRELTDALVLDVLEVCSDVELDSIPYKYVLNSFTSYGAWEQAALWVARRVLPGWSLELFIGGGDSATTRVTLYEDEDDSNVVSAVNGLAARAILEAIVEAHLLIERG